MAVTANLVINFGDTEDAYLSAEIVDEDNDGKTSFKAGDEVKFRVYYSGNYEVTETAGTSAITETANIVPITDINDNNQPDIVTFAFSATGSTSKYIHQFTDATWIGTQPTKEDGSTIDVKKVDHAEVSGGVATKLGVAKVNYKTRYDLWTYSSPANIDGETNYSVVIGITATSSE